MGPSKHYDCLPGRLIRCRRCAGSQHHLEVAGQDYCLNRVTTPERTLVDGLQDPPHCGGFDNVLRAWSRMRDRLDLDVLVQVIEQFNIAVLRQRVGFILDELRITDPMVEAWRAKAKRGGSSRLLAAAPYAPTYSERWNLSINAPTAALHEDGA